MTVVNWNAPHSPQLAWATYASNQVVLARYFGLSSARGEWRVCRDGTTRWEVESFVAPGDRNIINLVGDGGLINALVYRAEADLAVSLAGLIGQELAGIDPRGELRMRRADELRFAEARSELGLEPSESDRLRQRVRANVLQILQLPGIRAAASTLTGMLMFDWADFGPRAEKILAAAEIPIAPEVWFGGEGTLGIQFVNGEWFAHCCNCTIHWHPAILSTNAVSRRCGWEPCPSCGYPRGPQDPEWVRRFDMIPSWVRDLAGSPREDAIAD